MASLDGTDDVKTCSCSWIARSGSRLCSSGVRWLGICGNKGEEVTGDVRKFHDESLNIVHPLTSIRKIKLKHLGQARHICCEGKMTNAYEI
jgi:hypothetical protein